MKCATTSLHYYLSLHPDISMSQPKELQFFVAERNWQRGLPWYRTHFCSDAAVRGESSTHYTKYPYYQGVPARMHATVPDAKLVYMVRDPITRALSHYVDRCARGLEERSPTAALADYEDETCRYTQYSRYFYQLSQYLSFYPATHILVLSADALRHDQQDILRSVFRFLHVDDSFTHPGFSAIKHRSAGKTHPKGATAWIRRRIYRYLRMLPLETRHRISHALTPWARAVPPPTLDAGLRSELQAYFQEDVQQLRALTGQPFADWSV